MRITNTKNLPEPFVDALTRDYQYKDKQYSVTQILNGTCETLLKRRHDNEIEQDVADSIWMIFGTAVHSILENAQETDTQIKENKLVIDMPNGYKLSGIFDLYDDKLKKVTDYKTASTWKVIYNDWDDYRKQTLIYCWMLRRIGFDARVGEIVALLKDHSKTKAKTDSTYPQYPVYKISWEFTDDDFKEIEKFIYDKFEEIAYYEQLSDEELIPCSAEERWATDNKWAIKKEGRKSAVRVFDNEEDAIEYLSALDNKHSIEFREAESKKCIDYCVCGQWCPFMKGR